MDTKLEQYRLRKRRQQRYDELKGVLRRMLTFGSRATEDKDKDHIVNVSEQHGEELVTEKEPLLSDISSTSDEDEVSPNVQESLDSEQENKWFKYTLKAIAFLFWVTCYIIAIELQFGIVFLMFSALLGIYFNTRTGPKSKKEISAYSVFNKDFQSIDGTLKAEQFEREIRYGSSSVR